MKNKKEILQRIQEIYPQNYIDKVRFDWATNNISKLLVGRLTKLAPCALNSLNWDMSKASIEYFPCDAYIGELNCLLVIDDYFKFSTFRLRTLESYISVPTWFNQEEYKNLCLEKQKEANSYQKSVRLQTKVHSSHLSVLRF